MRGGFHRGGGNKKCKRLADVQQGTFILGTCHTGIGCIHNQHLIILDQCAECDLLKFVQNQISAKQWTPA